MLLVLAFVVLIVIVILGIEFYLGATAKPTISENYTERIHDARLERQRATSGPGLNQFPVFESHMVFIRELNDRQNEQWRNAAGNHDDPWDLPSLDLIYAVPDKGTPEQFAHAQRRAREGLEAWRREGVFERTAELANLRRLARPPHEGPVIHMLLPNLGATRMLARAQAARAHLAAERGDTEEWLTAIEEICVLGRQIGDMGFLIDYLVGIAVQSLGRATLLQTMLKHGVPDEATLVHLKAMVERELIEGATPVARVLNNERAFVDDIIQRTYTDSGDGNGRFIPREYSKILEDNAATGGTVLAPFGDNAFSNIHGRLFFDRREANEWADAQWALYLRSANAPGAEAVEADRESEAALEDLNWRNPLAPVAGAYTRTSFTSRVDRIQAHGLLVLLAIEQYRLGHEGQVPNALDELGDLLPERLRTDPFTEQPWDYQPTPRTLDVDEKPLREGALAWPYTLRSRGLPGMEPNRPSDRNSHAYYGVLITVPIQGPDYDEPWPEHGGG